MENVLAVVALLALVGFFWFFLSKMVAYYREKAEAEEKRREVIAEHLLEVRRQSAARARARLETKTVADIKNTPPPKTLNAVGSGVNVGRATYVPSPTQSVNSHDDNFLSDVAMGMVINSLLNSKHDSQSGVVTENRDTGSVSVKVSESSWGFEDSDSRKSISSSMDTSSSSDSYSSSSSDSGPSSDW